MLEEIRGVLLRVLSGQGWGSLPEVVFDIPDGQGGTERRYVGSADGA
jgi:hypothetical protein